MKKLLYILYILVLYSGIIQAAQDNDFVIIEKHDELQAEVDRLFMDMLVQQNDNSACVALNKCCDFSQKNNVFPIFVQDIGSYYSTLQRMVDKNYEHLCEKCIDFFPLTKELCCQLITYICKGSKKTCFLDMFLGYLVDKGWPYDIDISLKDHLYKRDIAFVFWQYGACLTSKDECTLWQKLLVNEDKEAFRVLLLLLGWLYPKKCSNSDRYVTIPVYPHLLSCDIYDVSWCTAEMNQYKNFFLYAGCLTKEACQTFCEKLRSGARGFRFQLMKQMLSSQEKETLFMQVIACKDRYMYLVATLRLFNVKLIVECAHLLHFSAYKKWLHRIKWVAKNSRKSAAPVVVGIEEQQEKMLKLARSNYLTDIVFVKQ